jgi:hypothetical protein
MAKELKLSDDRFHARSGSPYWNESAWFSFMVPELKLDGFFYFYHRPNMHKSSGGVGIWDPSAEEDHSCTFYEFDEHLALPPEANMFDFELDNTLSCRTIELQKTYKLAFQREGFEVDLIWDAITEPHSTKDPEKLDGRFKDVGIGGWIRGDGDAPRGYKEDPVKAGGNEIGHYEQFGRMTGAIHIDGQLVQVDCYSARDHSWGPRGLSPEMPRNRCDWAVLDKDNAFFIFSVAASPWREDHVVGVTDLVIDGWYIKDGIIGDIERGTSTVPERDGGNRPLRIVLDAEDHLGRTLHAEGYRENCLNWMSYSFCYSVWALASWEWNGHSAHGEIFEWLHQRQLRRLVQAARAGHTLLVEAPA